MNEWLEKQKELQDAIAEIGDQFRRVLEQAQNSARSLHESLSSAYSMNQDWFKDLHHALRHWDYIIDRFVVILMQAEWPPVMDLEMGYIEHWVSEYDEKGFDAIRESLDAFLVEHCSEEKLAEMAHKWGNREQLKRRMPILREVVDNHLSGRYFSSISTMLPQVEGMLADANYHVGPMGGKQLKDYFTKAVDTGTEKELIMSFVNNVLLVQFEHGQAIGSQMSRHAILHGADVDYGNVQNSLRCILLFNFVQSQVCNNMND